MNWEAAIARNREALLEIILALMASVGLQPKGCLTTLPFNLYRKSLFIIRIAETAVRRLIFIAAHDLKLRMAEVQKIKIIPTGGVLISPPVGEMPDRAEGGVLHKTVNQISTPASGLPRNGKPISKRPKTNPNDGAHPLSPLGPPPAVYRLRAGQKITGEGRVRGQSSATKFQIEPLFRRYPRATHRHISFPLIEPLKTYPADPRDFSSMHHDNKSFSREPTPATALGYRLLALHFALTNIERQARRLLRWEARRDAALNQNRPHRMTPMRPGLPPFYSRKPTTEIEQILKECHGLTHYIRERRGAVP